MSWPRSIGHGVAVAMLLVVLTQTTAGAAGKRVAVLTPQGLGKKDASIAAKLAVVLKQHKVVVVPAGAVKKALRKQGAPSSDEDWVKLARKLKVDGFVDSTLSHEGKKRAIEVRIRSGADGSVVGQESFAGKGPPKRLAAVIGKALWKKLGSAVNQTAAPKKEEKGGLPARDLPAPVAPKTETAVEPKVEVKAEPESESKTQQPRAGPPPGKPTAGASPGKPADADRQEKSAASPERREGRREGRQEGRQEERREEPREPAEEPETPPARVATGPLPAFEVEASLRALRRVFEYVPAFAARNYVLNFYTPVLQARAAWFPIKYLGIFAGGELSLALKTGAYPTSTQEIQAGVQFRMPFSFGQVGATAAYFQHNFLIRDTPDPNDTSRLALQVPNTVYVGGRFGASARFNLGSRMQAGVEFAYRLVTSAGQGVGQVKSMQYFPMSAPPVAIDGGAFIGYRIGSIVEIRGGVDYRRYVFGRLQGTTMDGTFIDATGGLDQYIALFASAVGVFGSK